MPTRRMVILQYLVPPVGGYFDLEPYQHMIQPHTMQTQDVHSQLAAVADPPRFGLEVRP